MSDLLNDAMAGLEAAFVELEPQDFDKLADGYAPTLEGVEKALKRAYELSVLDSREPSIKKRLKRLEGFREAAALVVNLMEGVDLTKARAEAARKKHEARATRESRKPRYAENP